MAVKSAMSNVDLIRRFVFENQPVTVDQIAAEVRANMQSVKDDETARRFLSAVAAGTTTSTASAAPVGSSAPPSSGALESSDSSGNSAPIGGPRATETRTFPMEDTTPGQEPK